MGGWWIVEQFNGERTMKYAITLLFMGAMLATTGCDKSSSGGPGAIPPPAKQTVVEKPTAGQAIVGQAEDTFSLDTPMMSTKLAQGASVPFVIGIKRGKNIDQDVTLNFSDLPKGVTIDPANAVIMHGDAEAKLTVNAASDAALGDFIVKVKGHPAVGPDATSELKVTVDTK